MSRSDHGAAAAILSEQLEALVGPPLGGWVRRAACRGEGELFTDFPASTAAAERVARICEQCPVRATCEEYATRYAVDGVWAGSWHNTTTGTTTGPVDQRAPAGGSSVACGTHGGYRRHLRRGEPTCGPCRAANVARARDHQQSKKAPREKEALMKIDSTDVAGASAPRSYGSGTYSEGPYQELRGDEQRQPLPAASGDSEERS